MHRFLGEELAEELLADDRGADLVDVGVDLLELGEALRPLRDA